MLSDVDLEDGSLRAAFDGDFEAVHQAGHWAWRLRSRGQSARAESVLLALAAELQRKAPDVPRNSIALAFLALGTLYIQLARYSIAADAFGSAESLFEGENEELRLACQANRALALFRSGIPSKEIWALLVQRIQQRPPVDAPPRELLSWALIMHAADESERAKEYWRRVVKAGGTTSEICEAHLGLAGMAIEQEEFGEAEDHLEKVRTQLGTDEVDCRYLITRADLEMARKKWRAAEATLRRAFAADPFDVDVLYRLGVVAVNLVRYEEAESWFERTVSASPAYPRAQGDLDRVRSARKTVTPRWFHGWRGSAVAVCLFIGALAVAAYPVWTGPDKVVSGEETTTTCGGARIEGICPEGVVGTSTQVKTTTGDRAKPHDIPEGNLVAAGALAAAAFVLGAAPNFTKLKVGPIEVEQPGPSPSPVGVSSR